MYPEKVTKIFSKEDIEQLLKNGYSERDLVGLAACKKMLDMGLTDEQIDKVFFNSLVESLEKYAGADETADLKQYTSFQDMINKKALIQNDTKKNTKVRRSADLSAEEMIDKLFDCNEFWDELEKDCPELFDIEKIIRRNSKTKSEKEIKKLTAEAEENRKRIREERAKRHRLTFI